MLWMVVVWTEEVGVKNVEGRRGEKGWRAERKR